jgi:AcrR family transcriptional regulator
VEHTGRGDPVRTMALLWGRETPAGRGPKAKLNLERIVGAAVEVADAEGLAGLSMRAVAERLGVGAMSLYTHVPGKAELLDVMVDAVFGELRPDPTPGGSWRHTLERSARADLGAFRRHPWALHVGLGRSALGPNELDHYEADLAALDGAGLSPRAQRSAVALVFDYVRGAAHAVVDAETAPAATGLSDDEWWSGRQDLVEEVLRPERFPVCRRLADEGAFDPADGGQPYLLAVALEDFEFGLARVLDGLEAHLDRRGGREDG